MTLIITKLIYCYRKETRVFACRHKSNDQNHILTWDELLQDMRGWSTGKGINLMYIWWSKLWVVSSSIWNSWDAHCLQEAAWMLNHLIANSWRCSAVHIEESRIFCLTNSSKVGHLRPCQYGTWHLTMIIQLCEAHDDELSMACKNQPFH